MGSQLHLKLQAAPRSLCATYAVDKHTQPSGSTDKLDPSTVSLGWSWAVLDMLGHGDSSFLPPSPTLGEDCRDITGAAGCGGVPSELLPPPRTLGLCRGDGALLPRGAEPWTCCAVPSGVEILKTGCGQWEHLLLLGRREMEQWWVPAEDWGCCEGSVMLGAKGLGAGSGAFHVFLSQSSRVLFRSMTFSQCFMKRATLSKLKRMIHLCVR